MDSGRRAFLRTLLSAGPALAVADAELIERLLWVPRPMVTVPALRMGGVTLAEINAVTMRTIFPRMVEDFFAPSPLLAYLQSLEPLPLRGRGVYGVSGG